MRSNLEAKVLKFHAIGGIHGLPQFEEIHS
jgi:hypothetical protein